MSIGFGMTSIFSKASIAIGYASGIVRKRPRRISFLKYSRDPCSNSLRVEESYPGADANCREQVEGESSEAHTSDAQERKPPQVTWVTPAKEPVIERERDRQKQNQYKIGFPCQR